MSLHTHKARFKPGAAEWTCLALVALVVAGILMACFARPDSEWAMVQGEVIHARGYEPASTALSTSQLVRVDYTYTVDGTRYTSVWDGSWPRSYSPNALSGAELGALMERGYPLVVWYDPDYPARSDLHGGAGQQSVLWRRAVVILALALWILAVRMYPTLKWRLSASSA